MEWNGTLKLRDIHFQGKFTLALLLAVLPPLFAGGWLVLDQILDDRTARLTVRLAQTRDIKKERLEHHLAERRREMALLLHAVERMQPRTRQEQPAGLEQPRDRMKTRIQEYFDARMRDAAALAADQDLAQNILALDWIFRKENRKMGEDWTSRANRLLPKVQHVQTEMGLADLLLISNRGNVIFSLERGRELGLDLTTPQARKGGLGLLYDNALKGPVFQDFQPYLEGDGAPSAFMALPVHKGDRVAGVLAMRLSVATLNRLMTQGREIPDGLDAYLIGADGRLRSDSLRDPGNRSVQASFAAPPVVNDGRPGLLNTLFARESGLEKLGETHHQTITAWETVRIAKTAWRLVVERDANHAVDGIDPEEEVFLKRFLDLSGYYDLYLIRPDGHIFHTVTRQADFGTNLLTGPYARTNLGRLAAQVMKTRAFAFTDVEPYPPSNNEPAAFMARPLVHEGRVVMVVALQLPLEGLTGVMQRADGPGSWSDAFLLGADGRLRSDSVADPMDHSLIASFQGGRDPAPGGSKALASAMAGKVGMLADTDFKGRSVLTAYAPVELEGGPTWALLTQAPLPRAAGIRGLIGNLAELKGSLLTGGPVFKALLLLVCALFVVILLAWLLARHLRTPVFASADLLADLAKGREVTVPGTNRGDELGALDHAIREIHHEMIQRRKEVPVDVSGSADRIVDQGLKLAIAARAISRQAHRQAAAVAEVSGEMKKLTDHLLRDAEEARAIGALSETAAAQTAQSGRAVIKSVESLKEIAEKTHLVVESARQTNLLTMKTAIEAARAGKKGTVFSEMAEEVRHLAERSRSAADEIGALSLATVRSSKAAGTALAELVPDIERTATLARRLVASGQERSQDAARIQAINAGIRTTLQEAIQAAGEMVTIAEAVSSQGDRLWKELSGAGASGELERGGEPVPEALNGQAG